jgi:RNA polymerase sigma-70 factor (ECF subfamily)
MDTYRDTLMRGSQVEAPDVALARQEIRGLLEQAVAALPDNFRTVFVLRDVEGLSVEETAQVLGTPEATVKTRLFRARRRMQEILAPELGNVLSGAFPFAGADCAALTRRVLAALDL